MAGAEIKNFIKSTVDYWKKLFSDFSFVRWISAVRVRFLDSFTLQTLTADD
ncbi:MAG: hypothetical protein IJI14_01985 [Anaerolineaceae bacterium]|nr:hypothetical protein [Anaerolineaceae bacterium]